MVSAKVRNLAVGVVVIFALGILGWLVFEVGAAPATLFQPPQVHVTFTVDRADGLGNGSNITYKGLGVGRVLGVSRDLDTDQIVIKAGLWKSAKLPANLAGEIVATSPIGAVSALALHLTSPKSEGQIAEGAQLPAQFVGQTFIPPAFGELASTLNVTVKQMNDAKMVEKLTATIEITQKRIDQLGKVIEGVGALVGDTQFRGDITASASAIHKASDDAAAISAQLRTASARFSALTDGAEKVIGKSGEVLDKASARIDSLAASAGEQLTRLGKSLDNVQSITSKIDKGIGTAGQLVNDSKLYQGLVDSAAELDITLKDIARLIEQWEKEGFYLRLSK